MRLTMEEVSSTWAKPVFLYSKDTVTHFRINSKLFRDYSFVLGVTFFKISSPS